MSVNHVKGKDIFNNIEGRTQLCRFISCVGVPTTPGFEESQADLLFNLGSTDLGGMHKIMMALIHATEHGDHSHWH